MSGSGQSRTDPRGTSISVMTPGMTDDARYHVLVTRDRRFDGVFFVGVSTTGIYCRPICPARTPGRSRCTFYDTPAQAEAQGFRACLRCRPELAPGNADVDAVDQLVAEAAQRISEGALNDASVEDLARELGVSARHLRRATEARLGVSPVALAQSRRIALAKQLIQETGLSLTEVAFAAGYRSVRRFNAAFASVMQLAPGELRRTHGAPSASSGALLRIRLDYRPPYEWEHALKFLAARAIPGVEVVEGDAYRRVVREGDAVGMIEVRRADERPALELGVSPALVPALMPLVARVRRLFDLDARPDLIVRALGGDRVLGPLVEARPGLRVPGAVDAFEAAVRALLGQQVSVAGATTLAGRFAAMFGAPHAGGPGLTHRFPSAHEVAAASPAAIARIGLPGARAAALHGLAQAVARGAVRLEGARDLERFVSELTALPGIGPWTAHYLAMRALRLPDAFPASDLGVRKALGMISVREIEQRAEAWRPFRAYAAIHLWTSLGASDDHADDDDDRLSARAAAPDRRPRRAGRVVPADPGRARGARRAHARAAAGG